MSVYFEVSGESIWNPASRVGLLYVQQLQAAARLVQMETGVATLTADSFVVDPIKLAALTRELVALYETGNHVVLRSQLLPVVAVSLVLVGRAGSGASSTVGPALQAEVESVEAGMPI